MRALVLLTSLLLIPVIVFAGSNRGKTPTVKITNIAKLQKLTNGYYVLEKYINLKKKTYPTTEGFEKHPIYGEFEVENTIAGRDLKAETSERA